MLRDGLSSQFDAMFHDQSSAQFEQCLSVSIMEFVQNSTSRRGRECLENVRHKEIIGKSQLACQVVLVREIGDLKERVSRAVPISGSHG